MEKSRKKKIATTVSLMLLLLSCSGLAYYAYVLETETHFLKAKLNEYDDKLFRRDKELLNLMHKLDSTIEEPTATTNLTDSKSISKGVSEDTNLKDKLKDKSKNTQKPVVIIDSALSKPINEKTSPSDDKKSLVFNGQELVAGESVNLAVQFAPNSHILVKNSELLALVSFLTEHPKVIIKVSGHTQPNPLEGSSVYEETAKMHLELSKKRVEAVSQYLVEKGVAANQIMTAYYGGSKPKYANPSLNRRVEMEIVRGVE